MKRKRKRSGKRIWRPEAERKTKRDTIVEGSRKLVDVQNEIEYSSISWNER